jgi:hypothetical protein
MTGRTGDEDEDGRTGADDRNQLVRGYKRKRGDGCPLPLLHLHNPSALFLKGCTPAEPFSALDGRYMPIPFFILYTFVLQSVHRFFSGMPGVCSFTVFVRTVTEF